MSPPHGDDRLRLAATVLRIDAITVEVVQALRSDGVRSILLKGPAIARWLYTELGDRQYADSDLLVASRDLDRAERTLSGLGFAPGQRGWLGRSREWRRGTDLVDLHASLFGVETDHATAWRLLSGGTESIALGGAAVEVLGPAARAFHLATHAAQHDAGFGKPLIDLKRALEVLPLVLWQQAVELAQGLDAVGTFAAGLRRAGARDLVEDLGVKDAVAPSATVLLASDPPPSALGISQLAAATSMTERLGVIGRGLVPPTRYMRREYEFASLGLPGLTLAYVVRITRLVWHFPSGFMAWRRARRQPSNS